MMFLIRMKSNAVTNKPVRASVILFNACDTWYALGISGGFIYRCRKSCADTFTFPSWSFSP